MNDNLFDDLAFIKKPLPKSPKVPRNQVDHATAAKYFEYRDGALYWSRRAGPGLHGKKAAKPKRTGYMAVNFFGDMIFEHRLTFLIHHGYCPDYVDHINGNKADNRIENLRESDPSLNQANRAMQGGSSQYKGVYREGRRWRSAIQVNSTTTLLGFYGSEIEAAKEYDKAARHYFGEHARTNF